MKSRAEYHVNPFKISSILLLILIAKLGVGQEIVKQVSESQILEGTYDSKANYADVELKLIQDDLLFENLIIGKLELVDGRQYKEKELIVQQGIPAETEQFKSRDESHFNIAHFGIEQGNRSNFNLSIELADDKSIWVGTRGAGTYRFDGQNIYTFNKSNGFPAETVVKIHEDHEKNLWFCTTDQGVIKYDGFHFTQIDTSCGLISNYITAIETTADGRVWIGTDIGVVLLENGEIKSFKTYTGDNEISIKDLQLDRKGNLWMATWGNGLQIITPDLKYGELTTKQGLPIDLIVALEGSKNIHIGTYGKGICSYNFKGLYEFESSILKNKGGVYRAIWEDKDQRIWCGNDGGDLYCIAHDKVLKIDENDGLTGKPVNTVTGDDNGNIWLTSWGGGLSWYKENSFINYYQKHGIGKGQISCSFEDAKGNLWFGSWGGGLVQFDGEKFNLFKDYEFLGNNIVTSIAEDKNGTIWFSTFSHGLMSYKEGKFSRYKSTAYRATDILVDEDGLIVSYINGIQDLRADSVRLIHAPVDTISSTVSCIEKVDDHYLIGNNDGVFKSDNSLQKWNKVYEFINTSVSDIKYRKNIIWVSTDSGLYRINNENYSRYGTDVGLRSDKIAGFEIDNEGNAWVGTPFGLSKLILSEGETEVINFDSKNGQHGVEFRKNAFLIDRNNQLWFSTENALSKFPVFSDEIKESVPLPRINALQINDDFLDFTVDAESLKDRGIYYSTIERFATIPDQLELNYDQNNITFHISAIEWAAPYEIQYYYYLEGLESNWRSSTQDPKVSYTNLSFGAYTFHLKAVSKSGQTSEVVSFPFTVLPPWWQTWWAWSAYVLFLILLIIGIVKWQTAKLRRKQIELQNKIDDATAAITSQKNEIQAQHEEIKDSIAYAKRIQDAILPSDELIKDHLQNSFILYKPKDIVAGDFYWLEVAGEKVIIAAADCTGHGVPGAMVSVVCHNALNRSVREFNLTDPGKILDKTRELVIETFEKSGQEVKDGMDISVCAVDTKKNEIEFAGANNGIYIVNKEGLQDIKPDKQPVGVYTEPKPFSTQKIGLQKGDTIYLFSDGYADQFGGPRGKKFKYKALKELLINFNNNEMADQCKKLDKAFEDWRGNLEQVDDVCIIGIKL